MILKITELKDTLKSIYNLSQKQNKYLAVMIWGPPGVGKSAAAKQVAEELGIGFIDIRLSLLSPVDLRGLPVPDKEAHKAEWYPPEFLPNGSHAAKGILFLDEINLAAQSVMSAGYQLVLDRKLGEYKLPKGWVVFAAGNRAEDNAATTRFPAPLSNRFVHYEIASPDIDEWIMWAIKNGVAEQIAAFLRKLPQHLFRAPRAGEMAFPSPRSWSFASGLFSINSKIDSAVGEGVAAEFYGFLEVYARIPDIEAILAGKEAKIPLKTELDVIFATVMAIAYRAKPVHIPAVFAYLDKLPREFEQLGILLLRDRDTEMHLALAQSPAWKTWYEKNPDAVTPI